MGALPDPEHAHYYELAARMAWRVSPSFEFAVNGFNLLHERHTEYPAPVGAAIERSLSAEGPPHFLTLEGDDARRRLDLVPVTLKE